MNCSRGWFKNLLVVLVAMAVVMGSGAALASYGDQSPLTAIVGEGTGKFIVSPTASDDGTFAAEMNATVHDTVPNVTFEAYRTPDRNNDGIPCNGTSTLLTEGFVVTTTPGGSGSGHYQYHAPFPSGETFHVQFEFRSSDGSTVLQSDCLTLTVK